MNYDNMICNSLQDGNNTDRWIFNKLTSLQLAESFFRLKKADKARYVHTCGTYLEFKRYIDNSLKLHQANFCRVRLCPMCAWRRSLKVFGQVSSVMNALTTDFDYNYIFVTLTCRNVSANMLNQSITELMEAFKRLTKNKSISRASKGFFRCLEVTHNWVTNEYHPHFHVVFAVNHSYFTDTKNYISQKYLSQIWQDCLQVDYIPVVDIRGLDVATAMNANKSVAEVAKYAVKATDFIKTNSSGLIDEKLTDEAVNTLDVALRNRRLYAFGGIFKEYHKKLNLDDILDGDLIHTDGNNSGDLLEFVIEKYNWNIGYHAYMRIDVDVDNVD